MMLSAAMNIFSGFTGGRGSALERTRALFTLRAFEATDEAFVAEARLAPGNTVAKNRLETFLRQGSVRLSPVSFVALDAISGTACAFFAVKLLSAWFLPIFFLFGLILPVQWVEGRVRKRAVEFAEDYPTMLLAAASSIKVGLTPYQALERATKLLSATSLVRLEVRALTEKLQRGVPREEAVREFAASIRQPDLELFRSAFLLVLENGGRFSPTLLRLAAVSNNRAQLIRSAAVSTASMRMTANILLVVAPILVLLLAARTENYWDTFFNHPVANVLASTGIVVIAGCYALLRSMSNFKP